MDKKAKPANQPILQPSDIDELQRKLEKSHAIFLDVITNSLDGFLILDKQKTVIYANKAILPLLKQTSAELLNRPLALNVHLEKLIAAPTTMTDMEIVRADGVSISAAVSVFEIEWKSELCYVLRLRDLAKKEQSLQLEHVATHDWLTDLPNRAYFETQLTQMLQKAAVNMDNIALIYINLDNFKLINDIMGHSIGDVVLRQVSSMLQQSVNSDDIIARLGGDEFAVLLKSTKKPEDAGVISGLILDRLGTIFYLEGKEMYVNASIGIAVYPEGGQSAAELLKHANAAMQVAKTQGKNQYHFFSAELNEKSERHLQIMNGLRHVLSNHELSLRYQPIVDVKTLACQGFEVLLRWHHEQLGWVDPQQLIACAEETGCMTAIGHWILKQALADYKTLQSDSLLFVTVNMSANEFLATEAEEMIISSLQTLEIAAPQLVIELTETAIIQYPDITIKKFKRLAEMGIKIAIDDYGTGYSSLSLLKQLPIAIMKIDQSFIVGLETNHHDQLIVKSSIQLAHNLGIKVIAEGVETKAQFNFLKKHACDYVQGFYFSQPLKLEELSIYLAKS